MAEKASREKKPKITNWLDGTKGETSKVVVKKGESFRIRFGVLIFSAPSDESLRLIETYEKFVKDGEVLYPK